MPDTAHILEVGSAEAGQKLLQFLLRRLSLPQPLLHRWIRTGQIRVNGGRVKPFDRVNLNDSVRLPPFALRMDASARADAALASADVFAPDVHQPAETHAASASFSSPDATGSAASGVPEAALAVSGAAGFSPPPPQRLLPLPPLLWDDGDLLVFNKPAGLPVHTGTGHETDSFAMRLAAHYASAPFMPTPAHRLDKDTSGLLLVAASYTMLRTLQDALRASTLIKEYLAWVEGQWPHAAPVLLEHQLAKRYLGSDEKVRAGDGKNAACVAACLRQQRGSEGWRSLMHIRLLTGRTHQIRVQMAEEGHPLCGDFKYGGRGGQPLHLHAMRLILPDGRAFTAPPPWDGAYAVSGAAPESDTADIRNHEMDAPGGETALPAPLAL